MRTNEKKWWTSEIENAYKNMKFKDQVIFKGHSSPDELKCIIPSALAMMYVSFFEGFGIPIIEAMRCGTPVITSNVSCMPEIAGNAALLVDPSSVDSIAEAMGQISTDEHLRNELIAKGFTRAGDFSWDATAEKLWTCVEKILNT